MNIEKERKVLKEELLLIKSETRAIQFDSKIDAFNKNWIESGRNQEECLSKNYPNMYC